jgi:hypothetical protein
MRPDLLLLALLITVPAGSRADTEPVLETPHFAFHSDFDTNLEDALELAAAARHREAPGLFDSGPEAACFGERPAAERAAWNRAVDYYAEIVVPEERGRSPEGTTLRLDLAGVVPDEEWEGESRSWVELGRAFRAAAAPAYRACRWPAQDRENCRWILQHLRLFGGLLDHLHLILRPVRFSGSVFDKLQNHHRPAPAYLTQIGEFRLLRL